MTTHYEAKLDGVTFTRSTKTRTYTHMVVGKYSIANSRAQAEKQVRQYWKTNLKYYQDCAAGKHPQVPGSPKDWHVGYGMLDDAGNTMAKWDAYVAECKSQSEERQQAAALWVSKGVEGHVADRLADFDAHIKQANNISSDRLYTLCDMGWCGRPDLAKKLAAKYGAVETFILDAVVVRVSK